MSNAAPIIIKRRKAAPAAAHHGGAWKVAYADFVTAMMAFFLMMWLLNATTEDQRQGLADYFSPDIPVSRESGGGTGMLGGGSIASVDDFIGAPSAPPAEDAAAQKAADAALEGIARRFEAAGAESDVAGDLSRHIRVRTTDEGLIVELFDLPGAPLFEAGEAAATPILGELVDAVDEIFGYAENRIAVNGHVRTEPLVRRGRDAWGLSTARAERVRQMLVTRSTAPGRLARLGGFADTEQVRPDPMDARNNRVELILLRR